MWMAALLLYFNDPRCCFLEVYTNTKKDSIFYTESFFFDHQFSFSMRLYSSAMVSISTSTSLGRRATSTAERAG